MIELVTKPVDIAAGGMEKLSASPQAMQAPQVGASCPYCGGSGRVKTKVMGTDVEVEAKCSCAGSGGRQLQTK